jgi:hypothetical protein
MKENEREAIRWYRQAADDLRFAEWILQEGRFFDKVCFIHSIVDSCTELLPQSPAFAMAEEPSKRLEWMISPSFSRSARPI